MKGGKRVGRREQIQKSLDYIENNLKADIFTEELADLAGYSMYHYCRVFQGETGMPVQQYILRRRLLHGIYALHSGSSGIQAALDYGFDTYPGFYRAFRREFGCTPSQYCRSGRVRIPCRVNLDREEPMDISKKKAARILKHWNLEQETITDIYYEGTGSRNGSACYVGGNWVLKYTQNPGRMKKEKQLTEALEKEGLSCSALLPTAEGEPWVQEGEFYFYLTRRLPGRQLSPGALYTGTDGFTARTLGQIIGRLHLALQRLDQELDQADLEKTVLTWALPAVRAILPGDAAFWQHWEERLTALLPHLPRQIIHRDPNPGNILRDGEHWGFVDFELAERNIRLYDPCYAATAVLSETFGRDPVGWLTLYREILSGYDDVVGLTPEERQAAPYVVLANQLVCTAWFAGEGTYPELLKINKQMTIWLVEHFAQLQL